MLCQSLLSVQEQAVPSPMICIGAGKCPLWCMWESSDCASCTHHCQPATMSDFPERHLSKQLSGAEDKSINGKHVQKGSLQRKDLFRSISGSSQGGCSEWMHTQGLSPDNKGKWDLPPTHPLPSTSQGKVNSPSWGMVMEAFTEMWGNMKK